MSVSTVSLLEIKLKCQVNPLRSKKHLSEKTVNLQSQDDLLCLNRAQGQRQSRIVEGHILILLVVHVCIAKKLEELLEEDLFVHVNVRNLRYDVGPEHGELALFFLNLFISLFASALVDFALNSELLLFLCS